MQKLSELFEQALAAQRKRVAEKSNGHDPGLTDEEAVAALAEGLGCDPNDLVVQRIYRQRKDGVG